MALSLILIAVGYLMGSVCSAVIVSRLFGLPDPREEGSKNPGATNVLRLAGKKYAALVMAADLLKGTIPVLLAKVVDAGTITVTFTALAAVIGHMFPVFFGFKGGKGVATAIGALLGFQFIVGVMVSATWLLIAKYGRYSSLASIVSITLAPLYTLLVTGDVTTFPPLFIMVMLILFKHRNNITRLIEGSEPKIKLKSNVIEEIMEHPAAEDHVEHEFVEPEEEGSALSCEAPIKTETAAPAQKKKTSKTVETKTTKAASPKKAVKEGDKPVKKTTKQAAGNTKEKAAKKTSSAKTKASE